MKDLVKKLLSFDETLYNKSVVMLKKTTLIQNEADEKHNQTLNLQKEKLNSHRDAELKKLESHFDTFEQKEKESFLNLKSRLTQNRNLSSYVDEIVTTIKQDLCKKKDF